MISLTRMSQDTWDYDEVVEVLPKLGALHYARQIFPIRKAVRKLNPDILHSHYLTAAGFYGSVSGARNKIVSAWGSDIYLDGQDFLKRQCIRYALNHSKVVLADSDHLVNECRKLAPKARVEKVIFGIDTELFSPKPIKHDKFTFLSIRATGGVYNSDVIVKAFEKANLDAILMMQEPLPDGFATKDYVKSRPELDKKVVWYSRRPYDQMPELYNSADVGLSIPSHDSSSTAMSECMACGVPVIASDIPQNREWIEDSNYDMGEGLVRQNGYLVSLNPNPDPDDEEITLEQIIKWIPTAKGNKVLGHRARETIIKNADWNTEMSKAERIYKEVLDAKK